MINARNSPTYGERAWLPRSDRSVEPRVYLMTPTVHGTTTWRFDLFQRRTRAERRLPISDAALRRVARGTFPHAAQRISSTTKMVG